MNGAVASQEAGSSLIPAWTEGFSVWDFFGSTPTSSHSPRTCTFRVEWRSMLPLVVRVNGVSDCFTHFDLIVSPNAGAL